MSSWKEGLGLLEGHLPPNPPLFQVHGYLPVALLRYDPEDAWELSRQLDLMASRLEARGRRLVRVSLAAILWEAVDRSDPPDAFDKLCDVERAEGFEAAQGDVGRALTPEGTRLPHFPARVAARLLALDPARDIAFLLRVGALAPGFFPVHKLVEMLPDSLTVPTVLCYPGLRDGQTGLRLLGAEAPEVASSYRVNIYG